MTKFRIYGGAILIFLLMTAFAVMPAYANGNENGHNNGNGHKKEQPVSQEQGQDQSQKQYQGQEQGQTANGGAGGDGGDATGGNATINIGTGGEGGVDGQSSSGNQGALSSNASNDGVTVEGDRVENNSSNVVLVPNNNTESCLRVIGIAFGKNGESAALGWPIRSKKCDYEAAADDAFAAGERELGWFWKCQNASLYKTFKLSGMDSEEAKHQCHMKAVGEINNIRTIETLKTQLTEVTNAHLTERDRNSLKEEQLIMSCNDEKNRMLAACVSK